MKNIKNNEKKQSMTSRAMESDVQTNEANIKLQEAFYGENHQDGNAPTYIYNNTPAIKITGNDD